MRLRSGLAILLSAFTLTSSATGATLLVNGSRGRLVWPRDSHSRIEAARLGYRPRPHSTTLRTAAA